jgi:serine protease Do
MEPLDPNRVPEPANEAPAAGGAEFSDPAQVEVGGPPMSDQDGGPIPNQNGPSLPVVVASKLPETPSQIDELLSLRSQSEQGNLRAADLPTETFLGSAEPGFASRSAGLTGGSNFTAGDGSDHTATGQASSTNLAYPPGSTFSVNPVVVGEPRQVNMTSASEVWKSLSWLAIMILVFLGAITAGPKLVEQYQYASTRGKMRAQYEAATDMLSKVSMRDSALASELVVHRIRPSVVSIQAGSKSRNRYRQALTRGQGSGFVISEDGLIVTNNHVIEKAEEIIITLTDRREYPAKVIGRDVETDLAVLKIEASDLIAAEWGDSDVLELGAPVWAMGSPFGLDQTVTRGIVSGKHRRTADNTGGANPHQDLLQTDAAVNPGNSGGPLVNSVGQVIGINTSIYGEFFQGISFAVPSALAKEIVDKLVKHGHVRRGFLGVQPRDVTHQDAIRLKLPEILGARLETVELYQPAAIAGLQYDDVVVRIGGKAVDNHMHLFRHIALTSPGDETTIEYYRDGELLTTNVKVGDRPLR